MRRTRQITIFTTLCLLLDLGTLLPRGTCDLLLGETTPTDVTIGPGLGRSGFSGGYDATFLSSNRDSFARSRDHKQNLGTDSYYRNDKDDEEVVDEWRNNERGSELKWRDVNAVPSFPFSHFARPYSSVVLKESTTVADTVESESPRSVKQLPLRDDYDADYALIPEKLTRRSRPTYDHQHVLRVQSGRQNEYEYELENEEYLRPRPRKRRPPQFVPSYSRETLPSHENSQLRGSTTERTNNEALKSLLKMQQEEGSSLSEVLRRKNLTLIDLLKGNVELIDILKMEDIDEMGEDFEEMAAMMMSDVSMDKIVPRTSTVASFNESDEVPFGVEKTNGTLTTIMPPVLENSVEFRSVDDVNDTAVPLTTSSSVVVEASAHSRNNDDDVTKDFDEPPRISGQDKGVQELEEDEIMEFSDFMDYKKQESNTTVSSVWPPTSSEKHKEGTDNSFLKVSVKGGSSEKISKYEDTSLENGHVSGLEMSLNNHSLESNSSTTNVHEEDFETFSDQEYQKDVPMTDYIEDEEEYFTISPPSSSSPFPSIPTTENLLETTFKNPQKFLDGEEDNQKNKKYEDILSEIEPEARAEILELFASGSSAEKLEHLLKSRNMSIEELIALRQRGSSKVHLVEVSRLKTEQDIPQLLPTSEIQVNQTTVTNETTQENEEITTSVSSTNGQHDEEYLSTTINNLQQFPVKVEQKTSTHTVEITDLLTTFASLPFGKSKQNHYDFKKPSENGFVDQKHFDTTDVDQITFSPSTDGNTQTVLVKEIIEEKLTENIIQMEPKEKQNESFSRLRPSIIASGAILGVTVVVFLTIFIVCRVRQKQKYRYRNAFSRAVFQAPVTAARKLSNSSSSSNVMVNVVATSTTRRTDKSNVKEADFDQKYDMDNDSLDANDSWETIPEYMK